MMRTDLRNRFLQDAKRARQEREQRDHLQHLQRRWRIFNLPVQEELALHARRFGLEAAQHATVIAERLYGSLVDTVQTTEPPSPPS
jgi:hypothetical protein